MERAAHLATAIGALIAVGGLLFGLYQFIETQRMTRRNLELQAETLQYEREIKAAELFLELNE